MNLHRALCRIGIHVRTTDYHDGQECVVCDATWPAYDRFVIDDAPQPRRGFTREIDKRPVFPALATARILEDDAPPANWRLLSYDDGQEMLESELNALVACIRAAGICASNAHGPTSWDEAFRFAEATR